MTRIYALLIVAALASPGCSWFSKHPVIPAVVTCSGETIPIALVTRVYDDTTAENWIDLAENVVPLLKDGYADLTCIWNYLGTSNPETLPHINAMKVKHADAFRGSTASLDSTKTRGVRPALPGADGTTDATASVGAREPAGTPVGPAATSLAVTALPSAGAETSSRPTPPTKPVQFSYPGENPGAALERCDRTCGEHLTSLATVSGCSCWRGKGRSGHWVALREAPGLGLVATKDGKAVR